MKRKLKWYNKGPWVGPLLTTPRGKLLATVSHQSDCPQAFVAVLWIAPKTGRPWSKKKAREFLDRTYR